MVRYRLYVSGIVQGVGFRPFVYSLAARHALTGMVGNTSSGVVIEIQGAAEAASAFVDQIRNFPPPLAVIDSLTVDSIDIRHEAGFVIADSQAQPLASTPISPDIAVCSDCLREMFDPSDRRYRYPFINCTNCGPRFTIIQDIPYDRPFTTMRAFPMCSECEAEYHDPANRRFHAQPNACPVCGPQVSFGTCVGNAAMEAAADALRRGAVVAIKGIGGFHLACDATNDDAVRNLRDRKGRSAKPFAMMARDLERVSCYANVSADEARLLTTKERSIVLLRAKHNASISLSIAPGNRYFGFLLPYSPLHHLLLGETPLVMTSGNLSDEPIVKDNDEALLRLATLADAFLLHNRDIHVVCDDSVTRVFEGRELPIRRSRGYSPMPVKLSRTGPTVLAVGGELKSTFCLTRDDNAYMSQHIGDMENLETLAAFEHAFGHFKALFRAEPQRVVCDLHPNYLSSRWAAAYAAERKLPLIRVQHHHAHLASVMAEHSLDGVKPIIGVVFDGTGYGTDGAIWGGEILCGGFDKFERLMHLKYVPLPGGDASIRRPTRMAFAHLWAAGIEWNEGLGCTPVELRVLRRQLETGTNCVPTSSMGRLFDAIAALIGVRQNVTYEAQAAIEMEAMCEGFNIDRGYRFSLNGGVFDPAPVFQAALKDLRGKVSPAEIATAFHHAVAELVLTCCVTAREQRGLNTVGLSGGVFQNTTLLKLVTEALARHEFQVLTHRKVPPNDGGLALGQAVIGRGASYATTISVL
ncbi:MAG: carbamoyltransferase HypF [Bryobacteraceae bacterium]